jgi:hypothetical protein
MSDRAERIVDYLRSEITHLWQDAEDAIEDAVMLDGQHFHEGRATAFRRVLLMLGEETDE